MNKRECHCPQVRTLLWPPESNTTTTQHVEGCNGQAIQYGVDKGPFSDKTHSRSGASVTSIKMDGWNCNNHKEGKE